MKIYFLAGSLCTLTLASCCTPWSGPAVVTTGAGVRICAKHRIALLTVQGFRIHTEPRECVDPDVDQVERVERCYPNAIPWNEWLESGQRGDRTTITYCPECERG